MTIPIPVSGASVIAARAIETAVGGDVVRDDVEVAIVTDPQTPRVVLASVTAKGVDVRVDVSLRRSLSHG
jgi:hypothetical protein